MQNIESVVSIFSKYDSTVNLSMEQAFHKQVNLQSLYGYKSLKNIKEVDKTIDILKSPYIKKFNNEDVVYDQLAIDHIDLIKKAVYFELFRKSLNHISNLLSVVLNELNSIYKVDNYEFEYLAFIHKQITNPVFPLDTFDFEDVKNSINKFYIKRKQALLNYIDESSLLYEESLAFEKVINDI